MRRDACWYDGTGSSTAGDGGGRRTEGGGRRAEALLWIARHGQMEDGCRFRVRRRRRRGSPGYGHSLHWWVISPYHRKFSRAPTPT